MPGSTEPPPGQGPSRPAGWQHPDVSGRPAPVPRAVGQPARAPDPRAPAPGGGLRPPPILPGGVAGEVRNVTQGTIQGPNQTTRIVITFRLEQHNPSAGRTGMVTVRMFGSGAIGFVSDGDWVEVQGEPKHGFLNARVAVNRTSGAEFRPSRGRGRKFGLVVGYILFFGFLLFIVFFMVSGG